ncbi:MAG TPA: photosynthetic complex assembly protein PuhC [Polyangiaceae bacterium LLY-WYZ-14_1]|nr:photosynthetic complex assembly protein PuhC [Polyangiaceae bacterium LLY-WYZ-14_1]
MQYVAMEHDHDHDPKVPKGVLIGAAVLLVATVVFAAVARQSRLDAVAAAGGASEPEAAVSLLFEDRPDGAVVIKEAETERPVKVIEPGTEGFVRGVLRGMFRTRMLEEIDRDRPFRLARHADGRFVLSDPESGRRVELRSFGRTNYESFAEILDQGRKAQR